MISALANSRIGRSASLALGIQPAVNPLKDLRQNDLYMKPIPSKQDLKPFFEPVTPRMNYDSSRQDNKYLGMGLMAYVFK